MSEHDKVTPEMRERLAISMRDHDDWMSDDAILRFAASEAELAVESYNSEIAKLRALCGRAADWMDGILPITDEREIHAALESVGRIVAEALNRASVVLPTRRAGR